MNYKYRMHDPRLGRFFAVDPLAPDYPWNSPYAFSENKVINCVELEGLESLDAIGRDGQPVFKQKAILTLPDASQVMIWNAQVGGRYIISQQDLERINSFSTQGFSAQFQIAQHSSTNIGFGNNYIVAPVWLDGVTTDTKKFNSATIKAPRNVIINPQQQVQIDIYSGRYVTNNGNPVDANSTNNDNIASQSAIIANLINTGMDNLISSAPDGAILNNFQVNISINQNLNSVQKELVQSSIKANINPLINVSFSALDPATNPTALSLENPNSILTDNTEITATQTGPANRIPTIQIISMP